jgi:cytochrome c biogenesis protein CcmG/thiol:disulfide interchange protein DsbE
MSQNIPDAAPETRRGVPLWAQIVVWVGLISLLVVLALGLKRTQQGHVSKGDAVPDFTLTTFDSRQITLSSLKGKVVVINFWASWCKPCEQEAAELEQAWQYYRPTEKVVFLGADYVDTEPEARAYLKKFGITYPNGPDLGTRISQAFRIQGVPETYFIGPDGTLTFAQIGPFTTADDIRSIIDPLIR